MSTVLSSPDITGIDKLYEIYQTTPDRDITITNISQFYSFLSKNSISRQLFLEEYCDYSFIPTGRIVVLKLSPKV